MKKSPKSKVKKALVSEKSVDLEPSNEEIFVLKVWNLIDGNPLLKEMPKPSQEYLENYIRTLPTLKTLNPVEIREHILNMAALSYIRDLLWRDLSIAIEDYPKNWKGHFDDKHIRLLKDVIKEEEKFLPKIFKDAGVSGEMIRSGKTILKTIRERSIEFEVQDDEKTVIDGKAVVVEDDEEAVG